MVRVAKMEVYLALLTSNLIVSWKHLQTVPLPCKRPQIPCHFVQCLLSLTFHMKNLETRTYEELKLFIFISSADWGKWFSNWMVFLPSCNCLFVFMFCLRNPKNPCFSSTCSKSLQYKCKEALILIWFLSMLSHRSVLLLSTSLQCVLLRFCYLLIVVKLHASLCTCPYFILTLSVRGSSPLIGSHSTSNIKIIHIMLQAA